MPKKTIPELSVKDKAKTLSKYVDWKLIFPRSKTKSGRPDLRKNISKYSAAKINEYYNEFLQAGGEKKFKPVRKSHKKDVAQFATATPKAFKGYFSAFDDFELTGVNRFKAVFKNKKSGRQSFIIVHTFDTAPMSVEQLKSQINKAFDQKPRETISVGIMNGSDKYQMTRPDEKDTLIDGAAKDFEKYAAMSITKEKRDNGRIAAHPEKWMRGVAFVTKRSKI